jgi:signal transduction histidine kinase/DNA-binding NarL/FixJ family response regulator
MSPERAGRILLIEDDEVDRLALRRTLAKTDLRPAVIEVSDCAKAREVLHGEGADCVLLDIYLPDGDGLALLREVRASGLEAPVIVLTGQGDEALAVELMKAGAADYLPKNLLTPEALVHSIRRAFRIRDAERQIREVEDQLLRQANQMHRLAQIGSEVHAAGSAEQALELMARLARQLIGARLSVAVWPIDAKGPPYLAAAFLDGVSGGPAQGHRGPAMFWDEVVRQQNQPLRLGAEQIRVHEARASPDGGSPPGDWRGLLAVPLINRDGVAVGSLQLFDPLAPAFSPLDEDILLQLGRTSSVALENARLYREARAATDAREQVLAVVSHDLRNPLSLIQMNASLLAKDLASASTPAVAALSHLKRIERGGARMERLIADLLDASGIDANALPVHVVPELAGALMAEAAEMGQLLSDAKGCSFVVQAVDEAVRVLADRGRILQVFSNLIGNALKFTPPGAGQIVLRAERRGDKVAFMVSDNGPGIPPEHVARLFDRFWHGNESPQGGVGLGLFIARGIVEAHGGTIGVDSAPGQGATICFQLPVPPDVPHDVGDPKVGRSSEGSAPRLTAVR